MNQMKFRGKITLIQDVQTGESARGAWKSVSFLVKEDKPDAEYPQSAIFKMFGIEKVDNFIQYNSVGKLVDVSFNLKVNAGSTPGTYYNNLDAWKVFSATADTPPPANTPEPDDLPF